MLLYMFYFKTIFSILNMMMICFFRQNYSIQHDEAFFCGGKQMSFGSYALFALKLRVLFGANVEKTNGSLV